MAITLTLIIVFGIAVTILGVVWMVMSFITKVSGAGDGATKSEIKALQEHVNHIQEEIISLQKRLDSLSRLLKVASKRRKWYAVSNTDITWGAALFDTQIRRCTVHYYGGSY